MRSWFKARLGRIRISTLVLLVAFCALFWVHQTFEPAPGPQTPANQVVPPGFVPDPNYTWVPRTDVQPPEETTTTSPTETTTTTSPDETTTTSPGETTSPTDTTPATTTPTQTPTTVTTGPEPTPPPAN